MTDHTPAPIDWDMYNARTIAAMKKPEDLTPIERAYVEAAREAARAGFEVALLRPDFSHVSTRMWCGQEIAHAYRSDPASPSGVLLAASLQMEEAEPLLTEYGKRYTFGPTRGDKAEGRAK